MELVRTNVDVINAALDQRSLSIGGDAHGVEIVHHAPYLARLQFTQIEAQKLFLVDSFFS